MLFCSSNASANKKMVHKTDQSHPAEIKGNKPTMLERCNSMSPLQLFYWKAMGM
jgi:hypothetical protein